MKKNILIVIETLGCGGAEKSLVSLLPELDYDKYDVDLLIHNQGQGMFEPLVDPRVHILPAPDFPRFCEKSIFKEIISFQPRYFFTRIKWSIAIRKNRNRGRHASEVYWQCCKQAFPILTKKYDVAIAWGQGHATHYVAEKIQADKKFAWINADYIQGNHDKEFDREFYGKFSRIVVVSDKLIPITQKVFPEFADKMCVVYDLVNAELIQSMSQMEQAFPKGNGLNILTMGRLEKPKGYELAVRACHILKQKGYKFTWYALGDGSERKHLESLIAQLDLQECFILLGAKANPYPYLKQADIYVQTSVFEGYCLTLAEARLLNRPIVTTNFGVVRDQIADGENGLIVEMDPEQIADGIIRLIEQPLLRKKFMEKLQQEKKGNKEEAIKFMNLMDE